MDPFPTLSWSYRGSPAFWVSAETHLNILSYRIGPNRNFKSRYWWQGIILGVVHIEIGHAFSNRHNKRPSVQVFLVRSFRRIG